MIWVSYDVLSTSIWFSSFARHLRQVLFTRQGFFRQIQPARRNKIIDLVGGELQNRPESGGVLRFCYDAGMYDILIIFVHLIVTRHAALKINPIMSCTEKSWI